MKKNRVGKNVNRSISLYRKHFKLLPRLIWAFNRIVFSCDIPYSAQIHPTVTWGHNGLGTVVGKNVCIGKDCLIMQEVTLGGSLGKKKLFQGKVISSPHIGEHTLIGVGAKIIGPVVIGNNVIIGAGAVVITDIPDNSVAVGVPAKVIRVATVEETMAY